MNDCAKRELDKIVNALAATGVVSHVYLFGSYARGKETPNSDLDLCVLTSTEDVHPIDFIADFHMKAWDIHTVPLDLIAYYKEIFYSHAKRPTSFEHVIAREGVLVYEHGKF